MTGRIVALDGVTCWLGHEQPSEQWVSRRVTLSDGRTGTEYETRCECGETIRVTVDSAGEIHEETNDI